MKNDFISQYKEYHKLNDNWEKEMRETIEQNNKQSGNDNTNKQIENFHGDCDHPNTMENGTAIFLYIIVMLVGTIFNARWLIWIVATGIFLKFITRHTK